MNRPWQRPVLLECPMCKEKYATNPEVECHMLQDHHVSQDSLQVIMLLVKSTGRSSPGAQVFPALNLDDQASMAELSTDESQVFDMGYEATEEGIKPFEMYRDSTSIHSDEPAQLRCHTCSEAFPDVDSLYQHQIDKRHLKINTKPEGVQCWVIGCNKRRYRTLQELQMHYKNTHKRSIAIRPAEIRAYKCDFCRLVFLGVVKLRLHLQKRFIESARKCVIAGCKEENESIAAIIEHMKSVHVGHQMSLQQLGKNANTIKAKLLIELPPKAPYIPGMTPEQISTGASSTAPSV